MYRSIKHTHRWPLKSHLYWQFGSIRAANIHQMTYLCVCAHSGVLIARVYTRLGCPCIRVQLTRLSEQATRRPELRLVRKPKSVTRCRFHVVASSLSLPRCLYPGSSEISTNMADMFYLIFCYFFISLLVGVLRISWISFQQG